MRAARLRQLVIKRLAVANAAAKKLRPCGDGRQRILLVRQQTPKRGMMPAEVVARAVAMHADALPQFLGLLDQLRARHPIQVFVHNVSQPTGAATAASGMDSIDSSSYTVADSDGHTTAAHEADVDVGGDERSATERRASVLHTTESDPRPTRPRCLRRRTPAQSTTSCADR